MMMPATRAEKQAILDGLRSSDAEVRRLSVEKLPQLEIEEAVPHLADRLGDEVWRVRKAAVEHLVRFIEHPPVKEMLIASLADGEDPGRRNSAFEALVACGSRVTRRLIDELSSSDADVRKLVVDALAAIADPAASASLVATLSDGDTNVRAAAAEALGMVGDVAQAQFLLAAVNQDDEDLLVRLSALRALVLLEANVPIESLGVPLEASVLRPVALTLVGISEDSSAVEVLLKALAGESQWAREAAMGALVRKLGGLDGGDANDLRARLRDAASASHELVESACERLESADLSTRLILIQFLGLLEDPIVVVPILMAGRDEAIQELSETTLENLGSIVPGAVDACWVELEFDLKTRACVVLGRLGGGIAEARLVESLDASDPELRCAAIEALGHGMFVSRLLDLARRLETTSAAEHSESDGEISTLMSAIVELAERKEAADSGLDVQLIESLSTRLEGASEPVRIAIAQIMMRLCRPQDKDLISYLLKDESASVRRAAVKALARFDFSGSREDLRLAFGDESEWVRIAVSSVLGDVGDVDAIDDLERMTHDDDSRVVAVAYRSLGRLCGRIHEDSGRVIEIFTVGIDRSAIIALATVEALSEMGGPHASELALLTIHRDEPEVVRAAIACVAIHGGEEDLANLLVLVPHPDWSVRSEVATVLARRGYRKSLPALLRRLELEDDVFVRDAILAAIHRLEE